MDRTDKEATTRTFHCDTAETLRAHALAFVAAYSFTKHLEALKRKTPFQAICNAWTVNPGVFKITRTTSSRDHRSKQHIWWHEPLWTASEPRCMTATN